MLNPQPPHTNIHQPTMSDEQKINLTASGTGNLTLTSGALQNNIAQRRLDFAVTVRRKDGTQLLLDPKPDLTPHESLLICQMLVGVMAHGLYGLGADASVFEWLESNNLCRHFRKVKETQ